MRWMQIKGNVNVAHKWRRLHVGQKYYAFGSFETRGVRQSKQNRLIKAVCLALHEEHNQGIARVSVDMPSLPSFFLSL